MFHQQLDFVSSIHYTVSRWSLQLDVSNHQFRQQPTPEAGSIMSFNTLPAIWIFKSLTTQEKYKDDKWATNLTEMLKSPGELSDCRTRNAPSPFPDRSNNASASARLIFPRYPNKETFCDNMYSKISLRSQDTKSLEHISKSDTKYC